MLRNAAHGLVLVAVVVLSTVLTGCGGHGGHHDADFGTIEIFNDDIEDAIVDIRIEDLFSSYEELFLDVDLIPGDSIEFDLFPSTYQFTLYWDDTAVTSFTDDIFDGDDFTVFVDNN